MTNPDSDFSLLSFIKKIKLGNFSQMMDLNKLSMLHEKLSNWTLKPNKALLDIHGLYSYAESLSDLPPMGSLEYKNMYAKYFKAWVLKWLH